MTPEEIKELKDELRIADSMIAKLTDQCREFEAHKSRGREKIRELLESLRSDMAVQENVVCLINENTTTPHNGATEIVNSVIEFMYDQILALLEAQLAHKSRPDRELLKIDVAIRLADFKGLDWNWASTQQSCLIEAHKIIALFPDEEEF